jgi:hypothetical protein
MKNLKLENFSSDNESEFWLFHVVRCAICLEEQSCEDAKDRTRKKARVYFQSLALTFESPHVGDRRPQRTPCLLHPFVILLKACASSSSSTSSTRRRLRGALINTRAFALADGRLPPNSTIYCRYPDAEDDDAATAFFAGCVLT